MGEPTVSRRVRVRPGVAARLLAREGVGAGASPGAELELWLETAVDRRRQPEFADGWADGLEVWLETAVDRRRAPEFADGWAAGGASSADGMSHSLPEHSIVEYERMEVCHG